jgi:sigma-70-like protein
MCHIYEPEPVRMSERVTEEQLKGIYNETILSLYGFASRRCGGRRELAQDVTQETWLRAVRDWRRNGLPNNPLGWLTTVARNLILNSLRGLRAGQTASLAIGYPQAEVWMKAPIVCGTTPFDPTPMTGRSGGGGSAGPPAQQSGAGDCTNVGILYLTSGDRTNGYYL